jgi:hypothetical protein
VTHLVTDDVLREEAVAIHGADAGEKVAGKSGAELYRELHALDSVALCLSGGGIRSASFALGVVEALAVHPRPESNRQSSDQSQSLLRQVHYLSTVSGGGYIGSWLSAWVTRAGFAKVWESLVGRRGDQLDQEPAEIAWLRAYSNYLTPKLGLFSADTWTAIALVVRNLILNWLVIIPAICLLLFAIKLAAVQCAWISARPRLLIVLALVGAALMVWVLHFATRNRPTCNPEGFVEQRSAIGPATDRHRDEGRYVAYGADQPGFFFRCLLPAIVASNVFSLYLMAPHLVAIRDKAWSLWATVTIAALGGAVLYAISWLAARPFKTGSSPRRPAMYWGRDLFAWAVAGAVYGALIGLAAYMFLTVNDASLAIGDATAWQVRLLVLMIGGVPWIITAQLIAEMIFVGLSSWEPGSDADREWFGRSTGWFAAAAIIWFVVAFLVLVAGDLLLWLVAKFDSAKYVSAILGLGSGLVSALFGASGKTPATDQTRTKTRLPVNLILAVATAVFLVFLVVSLSLLIDYLLFGKTLLHTALMGAPGAVNRGQEWKWLLIGIAAVVVVAGVAWTHVNINRFSIHALYRNRLVRAYLGASNPTRAPNPFTGFDNSDNKRMADLWPGQPGSWQPFHVVNMALNVVASSRLAWQQRKAESFTVSPLHCGSPSSSGGSPLGYRPTAKYADPDGGISLGTALAISGAAASPNMGYNSSPMVTLLLALFNVRLGWWLGNPGRPGDHTYSRRGPRFAIVPFVFEMFGQTTDTRRFVYLSDGGHFENLGLYEMIRRRCRCIVVSDAGCDPNYGFEDLGNAVRKIAIDLGVYISFGELRKLKSRSKDSSIIEGAYYAIGTIDYQTAPERNAAAEDGYILYIKPGYHGTESAGVVAYATANAAFPHETTADQFFSESQFESYRTLGFEIMDSVLREATENVETIVRSITIRAASDQPPSAKNLRDLVRALDPKVIREAEDAFAPAPPSPSDMIKELDPDALKVLRSVFNPGADGGSEVVQRAT